MRATGRIAYMKYDGRELRFLNQRSREWTHPYAHESERKGTLSSSGCGIFSICFAAEVMRGLRISPEELADFSVSVGGRGDDGTDRPALLSAMEDKGLTGKYGFYYAYDGLVNDQDQLWETLKSCGCALCNLRVGHIVTLIDHRVVDGEKQVLAMDCHSESGDARIVDSVREVCEGSQVISPVMNSRGVICGYQLNYALFWVPLSLPMDCSLLHADLF